MDHGKSRLASKTVWLGILTMVISVIGLIAGQEWVRDYPIVVSGLGLAVGILTVIVRHFTDQPLKRLKR